ncbi:hypothetical protein [Paenibacillus silvestris]|uniref:hypothetical protein n=1 Tax=Paenibacillus silvestris TaxID=2606219 RepID=UPI0013733C19|nr:hypothetical protein [Paenibacillus silvestris]
MKMTLGKASFCVGRHGWAQLAVVVLTQILKGNSPVISAILCFAKKTLPFIG